DGLLFTDQDTGMSWDTLPFVDEVGELLVKPGAAVYAVEVVGDHLYVGTEQSTVRLSLEDLLVDRSFFYTDSTTSADVVFAYPVPFSLSSDSVQEVNFRFVLKDDAEVTLEIYDVAMNLVKRVFKDRYFPAGFYQGPNREVGSSYYVPGWDGRNGKGDKVAIGIYYFKVETSAGDVSWGKLAIIP
ncbi:MAG: hypothetical protein DRP47_11210, partial [Candidatus Zixiibacteriota bacterium]